ncbi:hypothetical protein INN71_09305 [Nocardioides sp. ChNu-153]|nr:MULTISPECIES: hypothetical protein [unclassified Nocardioides]MDF9716195.1 hypothetical protein [Nocardioides sp. ChNu-99]MDN7121585.1 hypothetical protein [Nocardioides sp. ChNu-153]
MLYSTSTHRNGLVLTWTKVVDASGRARMEARWTSASTAVARPAAA